MLALSKDDKMTLVTPYSFDVLVNTYIQILTVDGTKESTLKLYERNLDKIKTLLQGIDGNLVKDIRTITPMTCEVVKASLADGRKPSTVNAILKNFKFFLNFCVNHQVITVNPMNSIKMLKEKEQLQYVPTEQEIQLLKTHLYDNVNTVSQLKMAIAVEVILSTANRITETLTMKWTDVNFETMTVTLQGEDVKNGKTVTKPLSKTVIDKLQMLSKYRKDEEYIFSTVSGRPIARNNIFKWLEKKLEVLGIESPISFHSLRRYVISKAIANGIDLLYVSKVLANHSSIEITIKKYVKLNTDKAFDEIRCKLFS